MSDTIPFVIKSDTQIRIEQFHDYIRRVMDRIDSIKRIEPQPGQFSVQMFNEREECFEARLNIVHGLVVLSPIWPTYQIKGRDVRVSVDLIAMSATDERRNRLLFSYDLGSFEAMVQVRDRFLPYFDFVMERCQEQFAKEVARREWMDETVDGLRSALKPIEATVDGNELKFASTTGHSTNVAIAEKDDARESVQLILSTTREEAEYILVFLADQLQKARPATKRGGGKR